jgi:hypothetical protein
MLTQEEKGNILSDFPNIKLSYENDIYKKVYNSDIVVAIPKGTKCFAYFIHNKNKPVCLIMELTNNAFQMILHMVPYFMVHFFIHLEIVFLQLKIYFLIKGFL